MPTGFGEGAFGAGFFGGGGESEDPAARWAFAVGKWDAATPDAELSGHITDRTINLSLLEPSTISFTVDGDSDAATYIADLNSDIHVWRDGVKIYRGRVVNTGDEIDETSYGLSVSCTDYKGLLDRRILYSDQTHLNQPDISIASYELSLTQGQAGGLAAGLDESLMPGGDLGITRGAYPLPGSVLEDVRFKEGDTVMSCIDTVGNMVGGFEWDIDPDKKFNIYKPQKSGVDKGVILDLGGTISKASGTTDHSTYANAIRQSGGTPQNQVNAKVIFTRGTASGGALRALVDTGQTWEDNQFVGLVLRITVGYGVGQAAFIVHNTADTITVDTDWALIPNTTSQYFVDPIGPTYIADVTQTWTPNQFQGQSMEITKGKGVGQVRAIASNTTNGTIHTSVPWTVTPDSSSEFTVPRTPDAVTRYVTDPADRPEGRWDMALGDTSLVTDYVVGRRADLSLVYYGTFRTSWKLTFAPGQWKGLSHVGLGDVVTYAIKRGRRFDVRQSRVYEISISLDDNDQETVSVTVERPSFNDRKLIKAMGRRVQYLGVY